MHRLVLRRLCLFIGCRGSSSSSSAVEPRSRGPEVGGVAVRRKLPFRRVMTGWASRQQEYDSVQYWDRRYLDEGEDTFDWYQRFDDIQHLLHRYIAKDSRILMAGCGNSDLSEDMIKDGYKEIVNVDISSVVIKMMRLKHQRIPELTYMTLDARDLSVFGDESFDAVIDKGLMDSLLCGHSGMVEVMFMLEEIRRVLKPGGVLLLVTYGEPEVRMHHFKNPAFNWKRDQVPKTQSQLTTRTLLYWTTTGSMSSFPGCPTPIYISLTCVLRSRTKARNRDALHFLGSLP